MTDVNRDLICVNASDGETYCVRTDYDEGELPAQDEICRTSPNGHINCVRTRYEEMPEKTLQKLLK